MRCSKKNLMPIQSHSRFYCLGKRSFSDARASYCGCVFLNGILVLP
jgi:hypothetical protein